MTKIGAARKNTCKPICANGSYRGLQFVSNHRLSPVRSAGAERKVFPIDAEGWPESVEDLDSIRPGRLWSMLYGRREGVPVTASTLKSDRARVRAALGLLFRPGDVVELRILDVRPRGYTFSGYFNSLDLLTEVACKYGDNPGVPAVYVTLNPCRPELLARAKNRLRERPKESTSDRDILRRRWLLIDCDAVRAAGISSTDEEHEAALARARLIRQKLRERGWPEPIGADSGNGAHLLYLLDLPNDDDARDLLKRSLRALAAEFDDDQVKVDQTVFNAGRIVKLYGTPVRKGDWLADRPHRLSGSETV